MSVQQIIDEIKALPRDEKGKVMEWMLSDDDLDDAFFAWADSLPLKVEMTEEEILALPRLVPADARPPRQ